MQCFRSAKNRSPSHTSSLRSRSLSINSLNKYLSNTMDRKSFLRRSFEIVRKNVLRQSQHLLRRNSAKARKLFHRSDHNDPNNNRSSYDDTQFINQHFPNTHRSDDDDGGGGGGFVTSTDADILATNAKNRRQYRSNVR